MKIELVLGVCMVLLCEAMAYELAGDKAYPSVEVEMCGAKPSTDKATTKKRIIELTHVIRPDFPVYFVDDGVGEVVELVLSMRNGSDYNLSYMKLNVHTGTHLDAPGHWVNEHYEAGRDVNSLDLDVLVGPVLIVDSPRDSNITARALESLNIPLGVERILFRTANSDKRLLWTPKFDSSYIGFTNDGAEWLLANRPDVKLVGTDYLSVPNYDNLKSAHVTLLAKKLILVESLNLDDVTVGLSNLICLPLRLLKAEGSPCRCILVD